MDVLVGPTSPRGGLFFGGEEKGRVGSEEEEEEEGCSYSFSSSSSSSIGAPDDDDNSREEEVEEDGVVSSGGGALNSLDSLEDSLPFKRGLSNYFSGKSKSFGNLSEVSSGVESVKDVEKPENPFNKKRRILLANKWASSSCKKSTFYTWHNPKSMPLLTLQENVHEEEEDHPVNGLPIPSSCSSSSSSSSVDKIVQDPEKGKGLSGDKWGVPLPPRLEVRSFKGNSNTSRVKVKSQSCLSLADLQ